MKTLQYKTATFISKYLWIIVTLLLVSLWTVTITADIETEERFGITFPELSPIILPEITEHRLSNGIVILLCEDSTFPTITISAQIDAGSVFDKPEKVGTASLTADLMRSGGTINYTPAELDQLLDNNAITLSSSATALTARLYIDFLSEDIDKALAVYNEVLRYPLFDENSLTRAKMGRNTSISRRNDDISNIAFREFHKLVYGAEHPFARHTEYSTIQNISRDDLIKYHQQHYLPDNMSLVVFGDFKTEEIISLLEETLGNWKSGEVPKTKDIPQEITFDRSVNLVSRPEADQTWIVIGHRALITRKHEDYIPMLILNDILGGGFRGRILRRIRSQLGLAYAPGAYYSVDIDDTPGVFYLMSQTTTNRTVEAIEALIDEIRIIRDEPVTQEELRLAKESYLNSFIFNYESTWNIINRQLTYMRFGYPNDFLEQIRDRVYDVTIEDIQRVAKKYLRPDDFIILAVGNDSDFDRPLSDLGEVNLIDITIPQPAKDEEVDISDVQIRKGKEIFHQFVQKAGLGKEVETLVLSGKSTIYDAERSSEVQLTTYIHFPDKFRQDIATPRGNITMIFYRNQFKMITPGGKMPLPHEFRKNIINEMRSNPIGLSQYFMDEFTIIYMDEVYIDGRDCYVLSIRDQEQSTLFFIDKNTMLPYQSVFDDFQAMRTVYTRFSEYEEIDGITYPMTITTQDEHGTILSISEYKEVNFNANIPENLFSED